MPQDTTHGDYDNAVNWKRKEWRAVCADMNEFRFGASSIAVDHQLYVFGGADDVNKAHKSTAECYDPTSNEWNYIRAVILKYWNKNCTRT